MKNLFKNVTYSDIEPILFLLSMLCIVIAGVN